MNQFFTRSLKTTILLSGLTIFTTGLRAEDFKIVDLKAASSGVASESTMRVSALNATYTSGTSSVQLKYKNMEDNLDYDFCGPKGAVYFNSINPSDYSYITIDNLGEDNITAVELFGVCAESGRTSDIYVAFSKFSSSATSDWDYSMNLDAGTEPGHDPAIHFYTVLDGGCLDPAKKVTLPNPSDTWNYFEEGSVNASYPASKVGSVKIALTTDFGIEGGGLRPYRFLLQSLTVYTDKAANTGVGEVVENSFLSYANDGDLNFTERASLVTIYNISGQQVQSVSNIQSLSLSNLPSGMYVVKATSVTGKSLATKIAR